MSNYPDSDYTSFRAQISQQVDDLFETNHRQSVQESIGRALDRNDLLKNDSSKPLALRVAINDAD
jgi:hypothetical protein